MCQSQGIQPSSAILRVYSCVLSFFFFLSPFAVEDATDAALECRFECCFAGCFCWAFGVAERTLSGLGVPGTASSFVPLASAVVGGGGTAADVSERGDWGGGAEFREVGGVEDERAGTSANFRALFLWEAVERTVL